MKRDPSVANQRQYESFKINVMRRANFDPRRTTFQSGPSTFDKNNFLIALDYKEEPSMFQSIMFLKYEDYTLDEDALKMLKCDRKKLYNALHKQIKELKPFPSFRGGFEVEGTKLQSATNAWMRLRSLKCSAQPSRQIDRFETENAKMNFLRRHLWQLDRSQTKAMAYGTRHESEARHAYFRKQYEKDCTVEVETCGLYLHTKYPGLSCSPDGIRKSFIQLPHKKLLEIKVLYSMRTKDPNEFEKILPKKKLKAFCLHRDDNGIIQLKCNHAYYDQVQFSMGILGLLECDLFLWTPVASLTVPVTFNEKRWLELRKSLQKFHWEYLAPEYFAQRCPRRLHPVKVD